MMFLKTILFQIPLSLVLMPDSGTIAQTVPDMADHLTFLQSNINLTTETFVAGYGGFMVVHMLSCAPLKEEICRKLDDVKKGWVQKIKAVTIELQSLAANYLWIGKNIANSSIRSWSARELNQFYTKFDEIKGSYIFLNLVYNISTFDSASTMLIYHAKQYAKDVVHGRRWNFTEEAIKVKHAYSLFGAAFVSLEAYYEKAESMVKHRLENLDENEARLNVLSSFFGSSSIYYVYASVLVEQAEDSLEKMMDNVRCNCSDTISKESLKHYCLAQLDRSELNAKITALSNAVRQTCSKAIIDFKNENKLT